MKNSCNRTFCPKKKFLNRREINQGLDELKTNYTLKQERMDYLWGKVRSIVMAQNFVGFLQNTNTQSKLNQLYGQSD